MKFEEFDRRAWPFYWITQVAAKYERVIEVRLKELELDIPSWRVLMLMQEDKPRSISFLADQCISKQPTMTRIVYRMKDRGFVKVKPSQIDARVSLVSPTKKGLEAREELWKIIEPAQSAVILLGEKKVSNINSSLSELFDNLPDS